MNEPKPCPFCGSPVKFTDGGLRTWRIELNCKPGCVFQDMEMFELTGTREQALNSWNQRNWK